MRDGKPEGSDDKDKDKDKKRRGAGEAVRLRQGDPAGARAAREHAGRGAARRARHRALAVVGHRRRSAGDGRRPSRLHAGPLDKGANVGVYAKKDRLVAGRARVGRRADAAGREGVPRRGADGQGHVIAFAEDPNYRAFTEASELLFINAVLLGPAH